MDRRAIVIEPHNAEAEQSVLGAILLDNRAYERASSLSDSDFYRDDHRRIMRHIRRLISSGTVADVVTVGDALELANEAEQTGGRAYLGDLANAVPSAAAIDAYVRIVRDHATKRALRQALVRAAEAAGNGLDAATALEMSRRAVEDVSTRFQSVSMGVETPALLLPVSVFMEATRPADWIVSGVAQRGYLYSCCAQTNHGKTAVMIAMMLSIAAGRRFCGLDVAAGRVAILCGENQDGFRVRLRATMREMDIDEDDIAGNLFVFPAACPLSSIVSQIGSEINQIGEFAAVLVDTSVAYFGGDREDDNVQALEHARLLRTMTEYRGRPAVIANTHPTKGAADRESLVPRGGSSFLNEIDSNLSIWADGNTCELHWTRKKRGPDFEPMPFEFVHRRETDCGIEVETVVARWIDSHREQALQRALNDRETAVMRAMAGHPAGTIEDWAVSAGAVDVHGRALKGSIYKVLQRLEKFKLVCRNRRGWYLTSRGRDEI